MGRVFLARDVLLDRTVAIKVSRPLLTPIADEMMTSGQRRRAAQASRSSTACAVRMMGGGSLTWSTIIFYVVDLSSGPQGTDGRYMVAGAGSGSGPRPACRLHGLLASAAPIVCVLRRGPTEWFHIARWNVAHDTVEHGAWLHATIYPARCAVSPDGVLLAAFIRDERRDAGGEWHRYFAVSKVPWLTALAAWNTVNTYTTGAHFDAAGTLVLAGTVVRAVPFHGTYPGGVVVQPTDLQWTRAALFRELRTGWSNVERTEGWLKELPVPLAAHGNPLVITRSAPQGGDERLALVSLWPGQREYYLVRNGAPVPLLDVVWAEWHPQRAGTLVVATSTGMLRLLTTSLDVRWEYDMNSLEPDPQEAPAWAASW